MARKSIEQIRAELDALNEIMRKKQSGTDLQIIAANARQTEEYSKKLSKSLTGKPKTKESIEKRKLSMPDQSGVNNSFYNRRHTAETKEKIGAPKRGKPAHNRGSTHTQESLEKMRKPRSEEGCMAMRGIKKKTIVCPHCKMEGGAGNMNRYHFDNCKQKKVKK